MPDSWETLGIVLAGGALAGFVQGLSGFAFAMIALSVWAWALPPQAAAPLAVFGALVGQLSSFISLRGGYDFSRILPLILGDDARCMRVAGAVQAAGFDVRGIRPPTVAPGTARLRVSITLNTTPADLDALATTLQDSLT